ncbi:ShlB/FhaC/HecB family hemolysin secretion/activation protein [Aliirhizobium terrae]|nr:ShlB/FhaC/HecB family hemolysin secretion/activation protein [Rhizobium sp. CC-CFT758]WJH42162.1 ShlB/FhaC/HecB family hemolysin secretion/activation protein [Rhizobium sp. CC-CFT758]
MLETSRVAAESPRPDLSKRAPLVALVAGVLALTSPASAQSPEPAPAETADPAASAPAPAATPSKFDIDEFRVDGAERLPQITLEEAIYPFLGPNRNAEDVEKARVALEKAYHDLGYQTVNVAIPPQNVGEGLVVLSVTEGTVGRLRVTNARYFDTDKIKKGAPSLKEGELPNFNKVTADLVALNQMSDRRVTPALRAGVTPGTVDVDLNVEDKLPFHGSLELNNRQSPNTTMTRLNANVRYDNLWQLGHSVSLGFQVAPERPDDATVFSASYLARLTDWTSVLVYGVDSSSDLATVGGMNVVGPGEVLGIRAIMTLPSRENYFHSLSVGMDYKHFGQTVRLGEDAFDTPVTYYPLTASYDATWQQEDALTQFSAALTGSLRGLGSGFNEFSDKRYNANANFFHVNADISHTRDIVKELQLFGQVRGQLASGPLVSSEQFSIGGLDTVRGYYESEAIGDSGLSATFEFRSPDFGGWLQERVAQAHAQSDAPFTVVNEWRVFGFIDAGFTSIDDPLADQDSTSNLASYGVGTNFKFFDHLNGAVALAVPLITQGDTDRNDPRFLFKFTGEF